MHLDCGYTHTKFITESHVVGYLFLIIKELPTSTFLRALISCEKQSMCSAALRKINGKFEDKNEEPVAFDFCLLFGHSYSKHEQELNYVEEDDLDFTIT